MSATLSTEVEMAGLYRAPDGRGFTLRRAASLEELDACVRLEQQTWGYPDIELVPRNLFVLAQALGGHVLGAWDEQGSLAGFALAIPAHEPPEGARRRWMVSVEAPSPPRPEPGNLALPARQEPAPIPYLHSHMLAVAAAHRDCGLGFALKLAQRQEALACGISVMRWTFDPLVAKNAYFNLQRLGATACLYVPDFYGRTGSLLASGLPTDRLLAEWRLDGEPGSRQADFLTGSTERILLPAAVAEWKVQGVHAALEALQSRLSLQFREAFLRGLVLLGFEPDSRGEGGQYLLCPRRSTTP